MIGVHFEEYWLFGLLFALVAPLQLAWAELVRRRPESERLLLAGAAVNVAIALVWAASRTTGLPIGPHPGEPEAVGVKDLLATADELLLALLVTVRLGAAAAARLVAAGWTLAAVSLVTALLPGGHP